MHFANHSIGYMSICSWVTSVLLYKHLQGLFVERIILNKMNLNLCFILIFAVLLKMSVC